jgi:hypothetical protein
MSSRTNSSFFKNNIKTPLAGGFASNRRGT